MVVLDRQTILELITRYQPVTNMVNEEKQISPNGVELTLQKLYAFKEAGLLGAALK